jgi:hypothetical protein
MHDPPFAYASAPIIVAILANLVPPARDCNAIVTRMGRVCSLYDMPLDLSFRK